MVEITYRKNGQWRKLVMKNFEVYKKAGELAQQGCLSITWTEV